MVGKGPGVVNVVGNKKLKASTAFPISCPLPPTPDPSLSPPVFRCHGDDVELHHRFCPINSLRGGASNPEKSTGGAIFCVSNRELTVSSLTKYPSSAVQKCAKLCIYRPVSVETRSEPRCVFVCSFWFSLICALAAALKSRRRCEQPPKDARIFQNRL